jgi:hypothetical protein
MSLNCWWQGGGGAFENVLLRGWGGEIRYGNQKCRIYTLVSHTGITLPHTHELVPWFQRFIFIIFIAINLWLKAAIDSSSRANQFELGSDPDSVS